MLFDGLAEFNTTVKVTKMIMYTKENTRIERNYRMFKGLTKTGKCIVCGDSFKCRSSPAKYCSQRCKNDNQIARRKELVNAKRRTYKACLCCCLPITQSNTTKVKKYCSPKCKQAVYRKNKVKTTYFLTL